MPTSFSLWWNALVRYRVVAVFAFAAIMSLTIVIILFSPRVYQSTACLLLRIGHENATLEPTIAMAGDAVTPLHTQQDEVETALGVMQSRTIMEEVVDRVGVTQILKERPPSAEATSNEILGLWSQLIGTLKSQLASIDPISDRERAIRTLQSEFNIYALKSSVVSIEYQAKHPIVAQNIVDAWVQSYLAHHAKISRTQGTYPFFVEQDMELKSRLDAAHRELREAKTHAGFATLTGQQKILEAQLETVRAELLKVEADLVESASRIDSIGDFLSTVVEIKTTEEVSGIANAARNEMRSLLFQLEVLEQELAAKYKDTHPKLVAIRDQLENARKIVDSQESDRTEFRQTANPTHQRLSENRLLDIASQSAFQEKKETLLEQQSRLLEEIVEANEHEEELARLTRNVEVLEERYKLHAVRFEQARLNKVLDEQGISSTNIIQPPSYEERPVSPDKKLCAIVGTFAALVVALSLPVLLDSRNLPVENHFSPPNGRQSDERPYMSAASRSLQAVASSVEDVPESATSLASGTSIKSASRPR